MLLRAFKQSATPLTPHHPRRLPACPTACRLAPPPPTHTHTHACAEIPPEREAIVFEEIATMEFPFEGIPTVPPRKDMDHLAFFCGGCRCASVCVWVGVGVGGGRQRRGGGDKLR